MANFNIDSLSNELAVLSKDGFAVVATVDAESGKGEAQRFFLSRFGTGKRVSDQSYSFLEIMNAAIANPCSLHFN